MDTRLHTFSNFKGSRYFAILYVSFNSVFKYKRSIFRLHHALQIFKRIKSYHCQWRLCWEHDEYSSEPEQWTQIDSIFFLQHLAKALHRWSEPWSVSLQLYKHKYSHIRTRDQNIECEGTWCKWQAFSIKEMLITEHVFTNKIRYLRKKKKKKQRKQIQE